MTTPRQIAKQAVDDAYAHLGTDVEYHRLDNSVITVRIIDDTDIAFGPDGFESSVQEPEIIYNVRKEEVPLPSRGEYIVDDGRRFDIVQPPEEKDRYEWKLTVKENT